MTYGPNKSWRFLASTTIPGLWQVLLKYKTINIWVPKRILSLGPDLLDVSLGFCNELLLVVSCFVCVMH